ncbi:hypothetical protein ACFORO_42520 [Amycolatopsis halotolerans]|uniref:Terminase n=1 Tax=Amycolatopsis halotolerans TaxID=330083 RepID=A0ABV7QYA0_9PSEU
MDEFTVDFPTLWIVPDWIEAHCPVPDRDSRGAQLELYPWQLWCLANHYRVKPTAERGQLAPAFFYRRSQIVMPQKSGKGPFAAAQTIAEALGPVVFDGWAAGGEVYACADWGCPCGWMYVYEPGEPMGRPWTTPLIQLLATSEDQVDNVYRPLKAMLKLGPLGDVCRVGEEFTRLPRDGEITVVTSSAQSRLGNPIIFAVQDETGTYTKQNKMVKVADTQRRGAAGMGGRVIETTNAWDPTEESTAQLTHQTTVDDVFRFFPQAPANLSFKNKADRRKIYKVVYAGSSHIDFDGIEAEVAELLTRDPAQAERFFGNRITAGTDTWLDLAAWESHKADRVVKPRTRIVLGFDGSDVDDWTALRAETMDGFQFTPTYGPNGRKTIWNPADFDGQVPRLEVDAAVRELFARYDVVRMYCDPPYWESEIDAWAESFDAKRVIRWYTRRPAQMHDAAERLKTDVLTADSGFTHDGCEITTAHVGHTRAAARPADRYVLVKASDKLKIDACVTSVLTHEAAGDVRAAGLAAKKRNYFYSA